MNSYRIAVLPGDGIGLEVTQAALFVLRRAADAFGFSVSFRECPVGGSAIDLCGDPLPPETLDACKSSDAVLLGAVGGPKWEKSSRRPEQGLLALRAGLKLYGNLRPAVKKPFLAGLSPLRNDAGFDILIVRELTGGLYYGKRGRNSGPEGETAFDTLVYTGGEIERILRMGFAAAQTRRKRLTSVDKANVLDTSRLWRETAERLAPEYPDVTLSHMLVDNAAMQLVLAPEEFDVLVTENMFGDILSDEAGAVTGSIGLLPSASLGAPGTPGLFEPSHGSAPDIAGKDIANPSAAILSAAMLLDYSLNEHAAAKAVESAVWRALETPPLTADIAQDSASAIGTRAFAKKIADFI
ncbi:MAG: 3-isopropylmalate dehydrogenase [Oscillospiraceae bacterium]|nr:3-isopropylmalate dehydrogenase [Oscillospiraceae bacterium]